MIKNTTKGKKTIILRLVVKVGNCWPVVSCLFLAHLAIKKLIIKANARLRITMFEPSRKIGFGPNNPLFEI